VRRLPRRFLKDLAESTFKTRTPLADAERVQSARCALSCREDDAAHVNREYRLPPGAPTDPLNGSAIVLLLGSSYCRPPGLGLGRQFLQLLLQRFESAAEVN
jgi:hypothetical protein